MHGVSSLSLLLFVKNDADIGHKSANRVADMARDLQRLILNNCNKRGVNITSFLLPAIKCSQLLLQQNGLESKQIRVQLNNIAKAS